MIATEDSSNHYWSNHDQQASPYRHHSQYQQLGSYTDSYSSPHLRHADQATSTSTSASFTPFSSANNQVSGSTIVSSFFDSSSSYHGSNPSFTSLQEQQQSSGQPQVYNSQYQQLSSHQIPLQVSAQTGQVPQTYTTQGHQYYFLSHHQQHPQNSPAPDLSKPASSVAYMYTTCTGSLSEGSQNMPAGYECAYNGGSKKAEDDQHRYPYQHQFQYQPPLGHQQLNQGPASQNPPGLNLAWSNFAHVNGSQNDSSLPSQYQHPLGSFQPEDKHTASWDRSRSRSLSCQKPSELNPLLPTRLKPSVLKSNSKYITSSKARSPPVMKSSLLTTPKLSQWEQLQKDSQLFDILKARERKGAYKCSHCSSSFPSVELFIFHLDKFKLVRSHKCPVQDCPYRIIGLPRKPELSRHCLSQHSETLENLIKKEQGISIDDMVVDDRPYGTNSDCILSSGRDEKKARLNTCARHGCGKKFKRKDSLQRHQRLVHDNKNSRFNQRLKMQRTIMGDGDDLE